MTNKNETTIQHGKLSVDVDTSMRALGKELLKANIPIVTISADVFFCNHFTIVVPAIIELNRIFEILFEDDSNSLNDPLFMRVFYPPQTTGTEWFPMLSPIHRQWDTGQPFSYSGQPNFPFQFAGRLVVPISDYDEVLRRVKEHNK
jgi:hypothetical protein